MTGPQLCSEADQDRLLLRIYALAPVFARGAVRVQQKVLDQRVVVELLEKVLFVTRFLPK